VLSGRGLCVGLITRPEESAECGVSECDCGTSTMRRPWPPGAVNPLKTLLLCIIVVISLIGI